MKTDVIIYGRVSTQNQDYFSQIEGLKDYCKTNGYNIVEEFTEKVSGAKKRKERKEISKLIEYVKSNKNIKGVLVSELSRLGRNNADVLNIIEELKELGIWVYSKKDNIRTLNDDGTPNHTSQFTLNILSGISEYERETIKYRSTQGLKQSVSGLKRWVGGSILPYGYKRKDKQLVIDEVEGEVVKKIFRLYLEGLGTKLIADELNGDETPTRYNISLSKDFKLTYRKGVKKGQVKKVIDKSEFKWKDGTIYGILTNKVYIGKKEGKGNLKGLILYSPPIIDENDFYEVQKKLKEKNTIRKTRFFYLFQNKLYCGRCNRTYYPHKRASKKEGTVGKDSRFICLSKRYKENCDNFGIGISKINDGVWSVLRYNDEEIKNILELNNKDINDIKETIGNLNIELEELNKEHKNSLNEEEELVKKSIKGMITDTIYEKLYSSLIKERVVIEDKIEDLKRVISSKKQFYKKRTDTNLQIRTIKENKRTLKKTIDEVIREIRIYPVFTHNLNDYLKLVKGDKFVFVEIFTYLNENTPLLFCVSQRSQYIITPKIEEYRKKDGTLRIGGFDEVEGEEEAAEISIRKLYHLSVLD
jgi:DNA invertase Pin-like site-specific DNA recombinase